MKKKRGFALIEVIVSLVILGSLGVTILTGLGTLIKGEDAIDDKVHAKSLVSSQIEYVRTAIYQYSALTYLTDPALTLPENWAITSSVTPIHQTDDGLQKVTVECTFRGDTVHSTTIYKADR